MLMNRALQVNLPATRQPNNGMGDESPERGRAMIRRTYISERVLLKNAVDEGLKDLGQAFDQTLEKIRRTGSGNR
jgi:hypothetical protein